ncbi:Vacuolar protein 8-like [Oopsacas minuta]|uniref:Vacuolar protein 8 n=1 Tax=Oopsacas minuta TaxID=111878 RepID=A0AAV7JJA3_9METZ|nr:Vacuolar protein 8-like [Oopsacas minuta]
MSNFSYTLKVCSQAAYVIRNLASADENQTKFVECGVLPPLYAILLTQQHSSMLASLAALRNLSIHPKNEIAIMSGGYPDLLSNIIKESKFPDMLSHAIGTIRNLCTQEQHETLVNQYNIPSVLAEKMGQEELRNEQIQGEITSCLAVLASYEKVRPALIALYDNKFLEVAVNWAEKGFNEVRYNTLGILGYLSENEECREQLINFTRILEVVKNFLQSPEAPYVHIGLWAIQQLLNNAADSVKQAIRNCGLELLVKRHTVNHDVKEISDTASKILVILTTK